MENKLAEALREILRCNYNNKITDREDWYRGKRGENFQSNELIYALSKAREALSSYDQSKLPTSSPMEEDPLDYTKWPDKKFDKLRRLIEESNNPQVAESMEEKGEEKTFTHSELIRHGRNMADQSAASYKGENSRLSLEILDQQELIAEQGKIILQQRSEIALLKQQLKEKQGVER